MTNLHFTLRILFAVVTVAAIGCAALAKPTDLWASVVFSGTLGLLVIALLVAVARRSTGAVGFALCGCAYLGLILAPGAETNIVPNLVTSKVLVEAESHWHPSTSIPLRVTYRIRSYLKSTTNPLMTTTTIPPATATWQTSPFQRIGHCLFALLFAIVGSVVARWLLENVRRLKDPIPYRGRQRLFDLDAETTRQLLKTKRDQEVGSE